MESTESRTSISTLTTATESSMDSNPIQKSSSLTFTKMESFFIQVPVSATRMAHGQAKGTKLNLPMQLGNSEEDFMKAFQQVERFVEDCKPEIILFQCGADTTAGDPIAQLHFSPRCHRYAAERLRGLADKHA